MSVSMREEAKRIKWRLEVLSGKHGKKAIERITSMVEHGFSERLIT